MLVFVAVPRAKIGAVGDKVDRNLALSPAANRADSFALGGTKAVGLALFADGTGHRRSLGVQDKNTELAAGP